MIVIFRNAVNAIPFFRCLLKKDKKTREVWLAPWECIKGFDIDLRENGISEKWKVVEIHQLVGKYD